METICKLEPEAARLSRKMIPEGMVLLKNNDNILPISPNDRLAVFGRCQIDYYLSGTGSGGSVNAPYKYNLIEGLLENNVRINNELLEKYVAWIKDNPFDNGGGGWAQEPWKQKEMPLDDITLEKISKEANKALLVIGRTAGEDKDYTNSRGSYMLDADELALIRGVSKYFKKIIILLNVSNIIDMTEINNFNPSAIIYGWHGGMEGGRGAADALCGINPPSGRLPDTIAMNISDYPSDESYYDHNKIIYNEDIYVGYRYFNTFRKDRIIYPFGYGLSYTSFKVRILVGKFASNCIDLTIDIENIGSYRGKEVIQIYLGTPNTILGRPKYELLAFKKTKMLEPKEHDIVKIKIPIEALKTFDDTGATGYLGSYVIEKGEYKLYLGKSSLDLEEIVLDKKLIFTKNKCILKCNSISAPEESFNRIKRVSNELKFEKIASKNCLNDAMISRELNKTKEIGYLGEKNYKLIDVYNNRITLDEFISTLTDDELAIMTRGEGMCSPKVTPGVASCFGGISEELIEKHGIPLACTSDGPSGMRSDVGLKASLLPIGTLLASSFNEELTEEIFYYVGKELSGYGVDSLLGPGVNIHRHPLCGRNFEYFSEDPLLAGKLAAAISRGLNRGGSSATIKHMCCNNKEENRNYLNSIVSERALREIYLRPFEIAIKEGGIKSIMTSYNLINGHYASSAYDITKTIVREEWNYDGIIMTDWWAKINNVINKGAANNQDLASMLRASNDLYMVYENYGAAVNSHNDNIMEALATNRLTRLELEIAARHILTFLLKTNKIKNKVGINDPMPKISGMPNGDFYYSKGRYEIYVDLRVNSSLLSQAASNIILNNQFIAAAQANGTDGEIIERLLIRVELMGGYYTFKDIPIKKGLEIVSYKLKRIK